MAAFARLREASTLPTIAQAIVEELAALANVRSTALVMLDHDGAMRHWVGDSRVDRDEILAYLDTGDATVARVWRTQVPEVARDVRGDRGHRAESARVDDVWYGPLLGADRVIGVLRVTFEREVDREALAIVAAHVSIRIAILGLDETRSLAALTPRQREVAELVAHGCTNREIARMLAISPNAVKKHVSRVLAQLEVSNRTELAAVTARWQLPSGNHQILPPTVQQVVRNPVKSAAPDPADDGA